MSTDLDNPTQEFLEIRLPKIKIETSQSYDDDHVADDMVRSEKGVCDDNDDECRTPRSPEHMIPTILSCPPAPKKPRRVVPSCKRKLCELQFFEINGRDEIESFFMMVESNSNAAIKRRCLV